MRAFTVMALVILAGCASAPPRQNSDSASPAALAAAQARPVAQPGSIYRESGNVALFEDPRAHDVGDMLTVLLVEATDAKTSNATSTSKKTDTELSAPKILGRQVTVGGTAILSGSLSSDHAFDGAGASTQSNKLSGSVTVTVVSRLPNGNLAIRGGKKININQGEEYVRVEGVIRPADIAPDNTILSSRIADAHLAYGDNGALGEANTKGWLARFFSSQWMPF